MIDPFTLIHPEFRTITVAMQSIMLSNLIINDKTSVMLGAKKNQFRAFNAFFPYRIYIT